MSYSDEDLVDLIHYHVVLAEDDAVRADQRLAALVTAVEGLRAAAASFGHGRPSGPAPGGPSGDRDPSEGNRAGGASAEPARAAANAVEPGWWPMRSGRLTAAEHEHPVQPVCSGGGSVAMTVGGAFDDSGLTFAMTASAGNGGAALWCQAAGGGVAGLWDTAGSPSPAI